MYFTEYHEREVFPSHKEIVITVNNQEKRFTGSSGSLAWKLEGQRLYLIVVWSIPYNLHIYNSYFGIGVAQMTTQFSKDILPYWYQQIMANKKGRNFQRGLGGDHLVYKHSEFFIIGEFGTGYHPKLNIRCNFRTNIFHILINISFKCDALADEGSVSVHLA